MSKVKVYINGIIKSSESGINRLEIENKMLYRQRINGFMPDTKVRITIDRRSKKRSLNQNSFYWGAVLPAISEETGHTEEELHEIFKRKFLEPVVAEILGEKIRLPGSTEALTKSEFYEYLQKIEIFTGIALPDPVDVGYIEKPNDLQ